MKTTEAPPDIIRDFFLEENPNPERIGCPPGETLKAAAEKRLPVNDPARLHLGRCSECFAEYRGYKLDWESKRASNRRLVGWAVAAVLFIAALGGVLAARHHLGPKQGPEQIAINTPPFGGTTTTPVGGTTPKGPVSPPMPPHPNENPHHPKTSYPGHQGSKADKGDKGELNPATPPIVLDETIPVALDLASVDHAQQLHKRLLRLKAADLNLSLNLPPSSVPGKYQLNLTQDAAGQQLLASAAGDAVVQDGKVSLTVHFPLQSIAPGDYFLFVAQNDSSGQSNAKDVFGGKTDAGQNHDGQGVQQTDGKQKVFGPGQTFYDVQVVPR